MPIAIAVLFSFNNGKSQSTWQGFSWRWYFTDPVNSVLHNPQLHAAVIQTVRLSVLTTADRGPARRGVRARHQPLARAHPLPRSTS